MTTTTVTLDQAIADLGTSFKSAIDCLRRHRIRVGTRNTCGQPGRCLLAVYFTKRTGKGASVGSHSVCLTRFPQGVGSPIPGTDTSLPYGVTQVISLFDNKNWGRKRANAAGQFIPTTLLNRSGNRK